MKQLIPAVSILWLSLMPVLCFSQANEWIIGEWKGGYFGEKSKITKKFDSRLQILKVYGNVFEGVVQCILPSDTTIRLHTRISGRIYNNYLMTKLKEVVYFKDPPGQYTWAKHCFTCDSMKLTIAKRGDSVVLNGERRCDTLCNIIARYSRKSSAVAKKKPGAKVSTKETSFNEFSVQYNVPAPAGAQKGNAASGATQVAAATSKYVPAGSTPSPISSSRPTTANYARETAPQIPNNQPLGHQTPGIDRDNVYAASMPRSGGESFFARPILKDSLSGSINFMAGRSVVTSGRFVVYVDTAEITLLDNGWVDGDTVSIYYNGQVIASRVPLNLKPYTVKIPVYKGGGNVLTVYAESLGSIPPNTAYVRLICGDRETSFLLSSNLSKSSSIELYRAETISD